MYSNLMPYVPDRKPPMGAVLNPYLPINRGLVFYPIMWEGAGGTVEDLSGNGLIGTFQGTAPSWTAGKFGSAVLLPGTDEFIDCGNPAILDLGAVSQTMCIWFSPNVDITPGTAATQSILSRAESNDGDWVFAFNQGDGSFLDDDGRMRFGTYGGNIHTAKANWNANQLYFICVSYVSATNATVYVDGIVDNYNNDFNPGAIDATVNNKLRIGVFDSAQGRAYANSVIEQVVIYNRALAASEVASLYREPFCGFRWPNIIELASYVAAAGGSMPIVMQQHNQFSGGMVA